MRCKPVLESIDLVMQPTLVADSTEAEKRFMEILAAHNPQLAKAFARHDTEQAAHAFNLQAFELALQTELTGLSNTMAFSLLRHNFEGKAFGTQERDLIALWSGPDTLFFSPGHGSPGAHHSVAASDTVVLDKRDRAEYAGIRLALFMPRIWERVAASPAAKKAKVAFYATCHAGVEGVKEGEIEIAAASDFSRRSGLPVVAPMGALIQLVTTKEPSVLVYTSVSVPQPDGSSKILHEDKAFRLFHPDGSSQEISFKEAMRLSAREGAANQYVNDWNSPQ